jgi:energy-coupling factor transporter ATP-binding protein EcfA2
VRAEVGFGPRQLGVRPGEIADRVESALAQVGLEPQADTHPYDLPAPERKMVAFAAALAQRPRLLVLDEPTQGLDRTWKTRVITALQAFAHQGGTVIAVTHDLGFVAECLERAVVMDDGTVRADEPARRLVSDEARCRGLGLVPPVTARVAAGLRLHGSPVKIAEVVESIRKIGEK